MTIKHQPFDNEQLASAGFQFFLNGSDHVEVAEVGLPGNLEPFVVRVFKKGWIPINALVFGTDAEHAQQRILDHLVYVKNHAEADGMAFDRAIELLAQLSAGVLRMEAKPFPLHQISKVQWASNDGFL